MKAYHYHDWADERLANADCPSIYDWKNMTLRETFERAQAVVDVAVKTGDHVGGFAVLSKLVAALDNKYNVTKNKGW